jgi:hypothetical protein
MERDLMQCGSASIVIAHAGARRRTGRLPGGTRRSQAPRWEPGGQGWWRASGPYGIRSGHTAATSSARRHQATRTSRLSWRSGLRRCHLWSSSSRSLPTPYSGLRTAECSCPHRMMRAASFIRATRERGVGMPSSRRLSTASREAGHFLRTQPTRVSANGGCEGLVPRCRLVQSQYRAPALPQLRVIISRLAEQILKTKPRQWLRSRRKISRVRAPDAVEAIAVEIFRQCECSGQVVSMTVIESVSRSAWILVAIHSELYAAAPTDSASVTA